MDSVTSSSHFRHGPLAPAHLLHLLTMSNRPSEIQSLALAFSGLAGPCHNQFWLAIPELLDTQKWMKFEQTKWGCENWGLENWTVA